MNTSQATTRLHPEALSPPSLTLSPKLYQPLARKPQTLQPKPQALNPKLETLNPKPLNPKPLNPKSQTRNPKNLKITGRPEKWLQIGSSNLLGIVPILSEGHEPRRRLTLFHQATEQFCAIDGISLHLPTQAVMHARLQA